MNELFASMQSVGRAYSCGGTIVNALVSATCLIKPSARIALVGPSGSGKSTLLHLLGGLDTPTAGNISWPALGPFESLRPQKISYVFQTQSLLSPLTVVENIEVPLLLQEIDQKKARAISLDMLDRIELSALADKLPEELSGGQAQRVAVARALASHPKLILADEPTGQLDHPTAQRLFDVLLAALEGSDTALVIATHDLAIAKRMDTVWQMKHGILEVD